MDQNPACEALKKGVCLMVHYGHFSRTVEVHTVGVNDLGHHIMSVWQVSGGSESNEPTGWKLLLLKDATSATLTTAKSAAPRHGYRRGAKQFTKITCQV